MVTTTLSRTLAANGIQFSTAKHKSSYVIQYNNTMSSCRLGTTTDLTSALSSSPPPPLPPPHGVRDEGDDNVSFTLRRRATFSRRRHNAITAAKFHRLKVCRYEVTAESVSTGRAFGPRDGQSMRHAYFVFSFFFPVVVPVRFTSLRGR